MLPAPLVEDIAMMKARAEELTLEIAAEDGWTRILLRRGMTSPVCRVEAFRDSTLRRNEAYVRATLQVVQDALFELFEETKIYIAGSTLRLTMGGRQWGEVIVLREGFPPHSDDEGTVDGATAYTAMYDAFFANPVVQRKLRLFCLNGV